MTEPEPSEVDRLAAHVRSIAWRLQRDYRNDQSHAVAALAVLRRGVNQEPGSDPRVAALTTAGLYPADAHLPDDATPAERAAHTALTLFATHQQSHRDKAMHDDNHRFGQSVRKLSVHLGEGSREAVRRRFTAVATAQTSEERLHHARGIIQQLRAAGIPLDYARFARDLYWLHYPSTADRVRRQWGRDFYRANERAESTPTDAEAPNDLTNPPQTESE